MIQFILSMLYNEINNFVQKNIRMKIIISPAKKLCTQPMNKEVRP